MTPLGNATRALFKAIQDDTFVRVNDWFAEHPEEQFAYWGKDEFLAASASDKEKQEFKDRHPEVEDLNDHTLIRQDIDKIILYKFCPKLKAGVKELYDSGFTDNVTDKTAFTISPDGSNYKIEIKKA